MKDAFITTITNRIKVKQRGEEFWGRSLALFT